MEADWILYNVYSLSCDCVRCTGGAYSNLILRNGDSFSRVIPPAATRIYGSLARLCITIVPQGYALV
jgi:hypothetical protein